MNIENMYLRMTEIYEQKYNSLTTNEEKKDMNDKLLDLYLSCLQFPSCPDR